MKWAVLLNKPVMGTFFVHNICAYTLHGKQLLLNVNIKQVSVIVLS